MNRLIILFLILPACLIPACKPEQYTDLEKRVIDAANSQSILIQVDFGEVTVLESEDHQVEVGGQALSVDDVEYQVNLTDKQILIKTHLQGISSSDMPVRLQVRIPKDMLVKVETDNASVFVPKYQGDLEVASTSGNITVEQMLGKLTLRSNRGNIVVRESTGIISVVGNYGALTLQNVSGETAASTIMGNVVFGGLVQMGDNVRLETDHGSVSVNLGSDSALNVQVRSTSGDVACMLPDITSSTRTCDGEVSSGGGLLSIRTVSGAVTLQSIP